MTFNFISLGIVFIKHIFAIINFKKSGTTLKFKQVKQTALSVKSKYLAPAKSLSKFL